MDRYRPIGVTGITVWIVADEETGATALFIRGRDGMRWDKEVPVNRLDRCVLRVR